MMAENNGTIAFWVMALILEMIVKSNRKAKGKEKCALARIIWLGSPKKAQGGQILILCLNIWFPEYGDDALLGLACSLCAQLSEGRLGTAVCDSGSPQQRQQIRGHFDVIEFHFDLSVLPVKAHMSRAFAWTKCRGRCIKTVVHQAATLSEAGFSSVFFKASSKPLHLDTLQGVNSSQSYIVAASQSTSFK